MQIYLDPDPREFSSSSLQDKEWNEKGDWVHKDR